MGYTTDFYGEFVLSKPLTPEHKAYLEKFNETRRMSRNENIVQYMKDPAREAVNLPIGVEGGYFVGGTGDFGQADDNSVLNHNKPPEGQPGLWCQWSPNHDGTAIVWDGGEKFYHYEEWLVYIIKHFLEPWGYVLNGEVEWKGEDNYDMGKLVVKNNVLTTLEGVVQYVER